MVKKKKWLFILPIALVLLVCAVLFVGKIIENYRIPYIAFRMNCTNDRCYYICSNGSIYASASGEVAEMEISELIKKIKQRDTADSLDYVGSTDRREVKETHRLFMEVVFHEEYYSYVIPRAEDDSEGHRATKGNVGGIYYDEDGVPTYQWISSLDGDTVCSDARAYWIADWMKECLKDYMK